MVYTEAVGTEISDSGVGDGEIGIARTWARFYWVNYDHNTASSHFDLDVSPRNIPEAGRHTTGSTSQAARCGIWSGMGLFKYLQRPQRRIPGCCSRKVSSLYRVVLRLHAFGFLCVLLRREDSFGIFQRFVGS